MHPLLPSAVLASPFMAGLVTMLFFGRRDTLKTLPGLLFHSIVDKPGQEMSHFSVDKFADFCHFVAHQHYATLCVNQAPAAKNSPSGKKQLLITFDDGFASFYRNAFPLLQQHKLTATIFCLGTGFGNFSTWDVYTKNQHLTRQEIRTIADAGHEIGSHTMTHPCLTYLGTSDIRTELRNSRKVLEDIIGKPVTSLAFPYGACNRRVWDIALAAGYTAATLYRGTPFDSERHFPVLGAYRFDTVKSLISKVCPTGTSPLHIARARMMAHFARGTPIWKYRREYVGV